MQHEFVEELRVFDPIQLYRLLDQKRGQRGLPDMKSVARASGVSASIITRLLHWKTPTATSLIRLILWAGLDPKEVMTDSPPPADLRRAVTECCTHSYDCGFTYRTGQDVLFRRHIHQCHPEVSERLDYADGIRYDDGE